MKKLFFITVIPPTDATNVFPIYLGTGIDLCEQ